MKKEADQNRSFALTGVMLPTYDVTRERLADSQRPGANDESAQGASAEPRAFEFTLEFTERIRLQRSAEFAVEADALARSIDHPIDDCLYAAVANRNDAILVTADAHFARKVPSVKTTVVRTS